MNRLAKRILFTSFAALISLFIAFSFTLETTYNDWLFYPILIIVIFLIFYVPFLFIRWAYRKLLSMFSKPVSDPTNSSSPDKNPAAATSLPMLYKIIILVPGPALVIGMLLIVYDPSDPDPVWVSFAIIMPLSAFAFYSLFLFVQWVYRKLRNTPIGEFYALPYSARKTIIEDRIRIFIAAFFLAVAAFFAPATRSLLTLLAAAKRSLSVFFASATRSLLTLLAAAKRSLSVFVSSILYNHKRTKKTINEIIKQINALDAVINSLEFQVDSYKNSKDKLEKEIYSENKPLFDNVDANINNLEHCVINYCETIEKALMKVEVKKKATELKAELKDDIKKGLHLKSKRLRTGLHLSVAV